MRTRDKHVMPVWLSTLGARRVSGIVANLATIKGRDWPMPAREEFFTNMIRYIDEQIVREQGEPWRDSPKFIRELKYERSLYQSALDELPELMARDKVLPKPDPRCSP